MLKHAVNCKAVNGKIRFIAKTIFAKKEKKNPIHL
jgi:hypothetical protein